VPIARPSVKEVLGRYFEFPPPGEWPIWWRELAEPNAAKAYIAIWGLASEPKESLPVMKKWFTELCAVPIDKLIADLDHKEVARRESAAEKLRRMGRLAEPSLRQALDAKPGLDARRRIEQILTQLKAAPAGMDDGLRFVRALEVLELIATAEAQSLLTMVAKQAPTAQLSQDARDALGRLARMK
jgi:hypothetical protein